jgi:DNA (cytosine-5)-methyltransferase 1
VLFTADAGTRPDESYTEDAFGFYWTEGLRGIGWAQDAVPTLKGGSTVGIPSPPAVWLPDRRPGQKFVTPTIEDAEALQGFRRGATVAAEEDRRRNGPRWKLVGNSVTVGVARWLGEQLESPAPFDRESSKFDRGGSWPNAAWGVDGSVWSVEISEFPVHEKYMHLRKLLDLRSVRPLSHRAVSGFATRLNRGNLGRHAGFRDDVAEHVELTRG